MKIDQIILVIVTSFTFYFVVKYLMQWLLVGEYNHGVVIEWVRRGFAFGLGFIASVIVIVVMVHILRGLMNEY